MSESGTRTKDDEVGRGGIPIVGGVEGSNKGRRADTRSMMGIVVGTD